MRLAVLLRNKGEMMIAILWDGVMYIDGITRRVVVGTTTTHGKSNSKYR